MCQLLFVWPEEVPKSWFWQTLHEIWTIFLLIKGAVGIQIGACSVLVCENFQEPSLQPLFCGLAPHRWAHRYRKVPLLVLFGLRPCSPAGVQNDTWSSKNLPGPPEALLPVFGFPPKFSLGKFWLHFWLVPSSFQHRFCLDLPPFFHPLNSTLSRKPRRASCLRGPRPSGKMRRQKCCKANSTASGIHLSSIHMY